MPQRSRPDPSCHRIRIIGGSLRGSRLDVADAPGLRPTPDRVRETLYNWLAPVVEGVDCLDLFAGSGALGIEALSRGAARCVFVEADARVARVLQANLQRLKVIAAEVRNCDATRYLQGAAQPFDLVLLDPPFAADLWSPIAHTLEANGWLTASAWIYVESPANTVPLLPDRWQLHREGRAGDVRHALYRRMR